MNYTSSHARKSQQAVLCKKWHDGVQTRSFLLTDHPSSHLHRGVTKSYGIHRAPPQIKSIICTKWLTLSLPCQNPGLRKRSPYNILTQISYSMVLLHDDYRPSRKQRFLMESPAADTCRRGLHRPLDLSPGYPVEKWVSTLISRHLVSPPVYQDASNVATRGDISPFHPLLRSLLAAGSLSPSPLLIPSDVAIDLFL